MSGSPILSLNLLKMSSISKAKPLLELNLPPKLSKSKASLSKFKSGILQDRKGTDPWQVLTIEVLLELYLFMT